MNHYYSNDRNAQILVSILKAHNIKKVIASPGTTNISFVGSIQSDPFFEIYSSVDERSAAYMACGLSAASGETVVIACTGATASRNYLPGLTEAFYRKLPILVIAGSHGMREIGNLGSQMVDRTQTPKDVVVHAEYVDAIKCQSDESFNITKINKAILATHRGGGGPVLIDFFAPMNGLAAGFDQKELPKVRTIQRFGVLDEMPQMPDGRIGIFIGSHRRMSSELEECIDKFCGIYDAVVFADHTSGYCGKYKINSAIITCQQGFESSLFSPDVLIHLGEVSGDTYTTRMLKPKTVWRVNLDGEVRDLFWKLGNVFEMEELAFFKHYINSKPFGDKQVYYDECFHLYEAFSDRIPQLKFGNIWVAQHLCNKIPHNSVLHFGIFNSLRSWNFFRIDNSVSTSCNVGGFGIDGAISTLIGSSLCKRNQLHFLVLGDLAFFYDMNSLGNRHVGNNIRILLINNGRGVEFRKKDHPGGKYFGEDADVFIAAAGHYGNKYPDIVKAYVTSMGFEYLAASNEQEFEKKYEQFISPDCGSKPIVFEVFTNPESDVDNVEAIRNIYINNAPVLEKLKANLVNETKKIAKSLLRTIAK